MYPRFASIHFIYFLNGYDCLSGQWMAGGGGGTQNMPSWRLCHDFNLVVLSKNFIKSQIINFICHRIVPVLFGRALSCVIFEMEHLAAAAARKKHKNRESRMENLMSLPKNLCKCCFQPSTNTGVRVLARRKKNAFSLERVCEKPKRKAFFHLMNENEWKLNRAELSPSASRERKFERDREKKSLREFSDRDWSRNLVKFKSLFSGLFRQWLKLTRCHRGGEKSNRSDECDCRVLAKSCSPLNFLISREMRTHLMRTFGFSSSGLCVPKL